MTADVLSEVLRAVRLSGAVFFNIEASPPWVAEAPAASSVGPYVMPGVEHVIEFHAITSGSCWGGLVDGPAVRLLEGDVIVFPFGDPHVISSAPGMRGDPSLGALTLASGGPFPITLSFNDSGAERARIVCGFLGCDARPFNPLLSNLPRVIHMPRRSGKEGEWVEQLLHVAVIESSAQRAGSACMLARLSELLFVEMVRRHLSSLPSETTGWLAGLRDDVTGRSLSALHGRPAHAWSLELLAKEVGLSRSMLAERFHHFVGVPPMQYLARWRMQLAASLLTGTTLTLADVAERVGYGSEAALSRAFKRLVGVAPSAWREGLRPDVSFISSDDDNETAAPPS